MIRLQADIERKVYRDPPTVALEGLRFHAEAGEFVAIVGPSGAGKTTLLNIVAGLDHDVEGHLQFDGEATSGRDRSPRVSFVFQTPRLMPWLTALDNVRLVLDDSARSVELARRLLQDVGLADFAGAFPGRLSGGMQRRLALARAFAVKPGLLLMDEPFVSLDAPTGWRLRRQLLVLWQELRPTVLYVTHNLREALTLADRILFLSARPGRVVLDQPVDLRRPRAPQDPAVRELDDYLLVEHPELLSGLARRREGTASTDPATDAELT